MSTCKYIVNTYGIAITSHSKQYESILEKLKEKHPDYFNDGQDEFEHLYYINDIEPNISHHHNVNIYKIETIDGQKSASISDVNALLVLHGDHDKPTLITSPFKSNQECIDYYKKQFGNILPDDFNYENTIAKIHIEAWD